VRSFVRSRAYARIRVATGSIFIVFGLIILFWTALTVHLQARGIPAYVMALALIALGVVRIRDYVMHRGEQR
jgi:uncharacterized membrane protein HdeD (DUF308 family)